MNSALRKFVILILLVIVGLTIWNFAFPYEHNLQKVTLKKRIDNELASNNPLPLEMRFGTSTLVVELADTEEERRQGLGDRLFMDDDRAMLFLFDKPGYYSIWMKDMVFPLDIAWLDKSFRIVHIERDVQPSTYPDAFVSDAPASYVIEVNAGYFAAHGIMQGDALELVDDNLSI